MSVTSNASDLYKMMLRDIVDGGCSRESTDAYSPAKQRMLEAAPSRSYELYQPSQNVPGYRSVDLGWAAANVLHFFTGSEEAATLRRYNVHADKFLDGNLWRGAYGAIALPQLYRCIGLLHRSSASRRAIVSMGSLEHDDINRPSCWSTLHFLVHRSTLCLSVYQRSMSLVVMPYDCVLLTNILLYVARALDTVPGSLYWTVGNLHTPNGTDFEPAQQYSIKSVVLPYDGLADAEWCAGCLEDPGNLPGPFHTWLSEGVRT